MSIDDAGWIQMAFPDEPEWGLLQDETLIQLVVRHVDEPTCAWVALGELWLRRNDKTLDLADFILGNKEIDPWLQGRALSVWMSWKPIEGFDRALSYVDDCDVDTLEEMIVAMNYEHQGPLSCMVHEHPLVERMKRRLHLLEHKSEFMHLFMINYGT